MSWLFKKGGWTFLNPDGSSHTVSCKNKSPRIYAAEICELKTREERRAALDRLPPDVPRGLVEDHVKAEFEKRKYRTKE